MGLISVIFFVALAIGAPVALAIGFAGFTFFLTSDVMPLSIGAQKIATVSPSFPLLAVPFFVMAGHLMNASAITDRLFNFSQVAVGWMAGWRKCQLSCLRWWAAFQDQPWPMPQWKRGF